MSDEKKIIIDEDWKSQVEAEKANAKAAAKGTANKPEPATPAANTDVVDQHAEPTERRAYPIPPASFPFLLSTLATPAFIALGQIPNPLTGKVELDQEQARHFIDMLAMLQEKTAGNLTPDEATMLDQILHELRLIFVTGQNSEQRAADAAANPPA
jgi:hypothetical protein